MILTPTPPGWKYIWSHSSLSTYELCPYKFYRQRVVADIVEVPGAAADYGTAVHTALEAYVRHGEPLPVNTERYAPVAKTVRDMRGRKECHDDRPEGRRLPSAERLGPG
jgi:hypothetical protein